MTDSPVILLDEPTSNFDAKAIDWYLEMVKKYTTNRLLRIWLFTKNMNLVFAPNSYLFFPISRT